MRKELLLQVVCLSMVFNSCTGANKFYKEEIPVGNLKSQIFDNKDFSFGEITITEITNDEFIALDGLNSVADLEGENMVRKYCSFSLNYFVNDSSSVEITISNLIYSAGTPSTYYGNIFYNYNGEQIGGITFIARTTGVNIITTVNQCEISSYYMMEDN